MVNVEWRTLIQSLIIAVSFAEVSENHPMANTDPATIMALRRERNDLKEQNTALQATNKKLVEEKRELELQLARFKIERSKTHYHCQTCREERALLRELYRCYGCKGYFCTTCATKHFEGNALGCLKEVEQDGKRLDWLEEQCPEWAKEDKTWCCFTYASHVQLSTYPKAGMKENLYCDTVRQAIDAAMGKERGE